MELTDTCNTKSAIRGSIYLKNTTSIDKLIESIPKIHGSIPNFGLPKWKKIPLQTKIPMIPGPPGSYNFSRQKIGKKLWVASKDAAFTVNDPNNYEMKMEYDMLHDEHMALYLSTEENIKHLKEKGRITDELDAKCTLRDYNTYREYLRKVQCDSIKKELKRKQELFDEKHMLQMSEKRAEKELVSLKKKEITDERKEIRKKLEEEARLQKSNEKKENSQRRLQAFQNRRLEEMRTRRAKGKAKSEFIQQKIDMAAKIARKKVIKTVLNRKKKEYARQKFIEQRLAKEQEEKSLRICEKWEKRQEYQKEAIEKEEYIRNCAQERRKEAIEKYDEKIARNRKHLQRLLTKVKRELTVNRNKSCKCPCEACKCNVST